MIFVSAAEQWFYFVVCLFFIAKKHLYEFSKDMSQTWSAIYNFTLTFVLYSSFKNQVCIPFEIQQESKYIKNLNMKYDQGILCQFPNNGKQSRHPIIEHSKRKGDRTTFWITSKTEVKNIRWGVQFANTTDAEALEYYILNYYRWKYRFEHIYQLII